MLAFWSKQRALEGEKARGGVLRGETVLTMAPGREDRDIRIMPGMR